ncbi:PREDICTED: 39S ribosomal protein L35, mitochondrial [Papilio polytes]|uniref:39S ribosomal protein L35, mitochondrial n=1 Tax=Papilio polytes TaxID=76194 RepID=UPI00067675EA|nr:PREDICTED: 39S ribosomal protein L35, mitochondrial [Papilio polytes]
MIRCAFSAFRGLPLRLTYPNASKIIHQDVRNFSAINTRNNFICTVPIIKENLINNKTILDLSSNFNQVPVRTVTKFSINKGKRKTVKAAVKRFFRLHWGGWIRTKIGRHKKLWKKSQPQKRRLRQHVFCNSTQSTLLDKMVTKFWKRPKYYVDDPYAPYHTREEFYLTRKKPRC